MQIAEHIWSSRKPFKHLSIQERLDKHIIKNHSGENLYLYKGARHCQTCRLNIHQKIREKNARKFA